MSTRAVSRTAACLKFAWEIFRVLLDLVRNNIKLQPIYMEVISRTFKYCLVHQRTSDFHVLSKLLRDHYSKYATLGTAADLEDVPTLHAYLDMRLGQLRYAMDLHVCCDHY